MTDDQLHHVRGHDLHVWRAEIVLLSATGVGTNEIMRRTGKSKTCVWRWQERFMQDGYDGLLRDKTRPSRIPAPGQRQLQLRAADGAGLLLAWRIGAPAGQQN